MEKKKETEDAHWGKVAAENAHRFNSYRYRLAAAPGALLSLSGFATPMQLHIRIIRVFHARRISQARNPAATNFSNASHAAASVQSLPVLVLHVSCCCFETFEFCVCFRQTITIAVPV
jgi:hypothetical protein